MNQQNAKNTVLLLLLCAGIVGFFFLKPIPQSQDYHQFVDSRTWMTIPNFINVVSNIFFAIIGICGIYSLKNYQPTFEKNVYLVFFAAIFIVAFGSAHYHWAPDNKSLVWDRIPITIAMMSFVTAIIADRISLPLAKWIWFPLILLGIFSVLYWYTSELHNHGDLRLYIFTQVFPCLFIPVTLLFYPKHDVYLWLGLFTYIIARISEYYDHFIFNFSMQLISGHSLKHLLMALAVFFIYLNINTKTLSISK